MSEHRQPKQPNKLDAALSALLSARDDAGSSVSSRLVKGVLNTEIPYQFDRDRKPALDELEKVIDTFIEQEERDTEAPK